MVSREANDEAPDLINISCFNGGMSVILLSHIKICFTEILSLAVKQSLTIWGRFAVPLSKPTQQYVAHTSSLYDL